MRARVGLEKQIRELGEAEGPLGSTWLVAHECEDAPVDAFSAPCGEVFVLYLTSLNQRRFAVFLLDSRQTDASHHTEVNPGQCGEPVPALRSPCRLLASPIARLDVHSPHRLLARCCAREV